MARWRRGVGTGSSHGAGTAAVSMAEASPVGDAEWVAAIGRRVAAVSEATAAAAAR